MPDRTICYIQTNKGEIMSEAVEAVEPTIEEQSVEDSQGLVESSQSQEENSDVAEVQAETQEELEQEIEDAIEDGATEEEVQNMIKEFQLKVNGKTITRKLDLSDEDAIRAELQKAYAGQLAMQQKAELEKTVESKFGEWKNNPLAFFQDSGLDLDEFLHAVMDQKIEEAKKSPEQIEREKMQKELEEARRREKELKEQFEAEKRAKLQQEAALNLDTEISQALDAHSDLPKTPKVVKKIADVMLWANENGYDEVTVEEVIPTVRKELVREINEMFSSLPLESVQQYFGKQNWERFRKNNLEKLKKKPETLNEIKKEITKTIPKEEDTKSRKRGNFNDFMRRR